MTSGHANELLAQIADDGVAPVRVANGEREGALGQQGRRGNHCCSRMDSSPVARLLSAACVVRSAAIPVGVTVK